MEDKPTIPLPKPAEPKAQKPEVKLGGTPGEKPSEKPAPSRLKNAKPSMMPTNNALKKIVDKLQASENILVALSRDPSVDELAAAIGLTLFLDELQKHVTAIYSGKTPDALQFLQPEGTFETNTDSLQDFIISLNKEKADHLRYKVDGDYVRVYITPYKSLIQETDLEFMRGDFNVDLVLAIGVPTAADLDGALSEYGRIMHDAMIADITCDAPGKFGEVEWSDTSASSVSEMIVELIFEMQGKDAPIDKEVATALLAGIVAATGRFSNDRTNSETFELASKLMAMGADQQLISAHVMDNDSDAYMGGGFNYASQAPVEQSMPVDTGVAPGMMEQVVTEQPVVEAAEVPEVTAETVVVEPEVPKVDEDEEVRAAMAEAVATAVDEAVANAAAAGATGVGIKPQPQPAGVAPKPQAEPTVAPAPTVGVVPTVGVTPMTGATSTATPVPASTTVPEVGVPPKKDYAQMLTQALAEPVQNEAQVVLPPPPAPMPSADMMPPVLPEVQVPEEAKQPAQTGDAAGAFRIPGL